jgi:predicted aldo/keto reductase-like oxidoreductase
MLTKTCEVTMTRKKITRRGFFRTSALTATGSVLAAGVDLGSGSAKAAERSKTVEQVPRRPFGASGRQVSILSLGGMFDIPSNQLMLKQALRWGVTYWDTADCYGRGKSEKGIGAFFKRYPQYRERVFLVTKSDSRHPEGMSKLLNRSLERMHTQYIDLYFVHGIRDIDELDENTRRWAEDAKAEGKIKLFGFSTHSNMEACLQGAASLGWIDGIMMTYNFRLMHHPSMQAAVQACADAGIGLTAMKTQGGGSVRSGPVIELESARSYIDKGFTDEQAKLMAVWEDHRIASICSQMPNMTLLMANAAAALNRKELSQVDRDRLQRYARRTASHYCAGCTQICESALGDPIPVGDVMRFLMYQCNYQEPGRARARFRRIPDEVRLKMAHADYTAAEQRCPQKIPIGKLMRSACTRLA